MILNYNVTQDVMNNQIKELFKGVSYLYMDVWDILYREVPNTLSARSLVDNGFLSCLCDFRENYDKNLARYGAGVCEKRIVDALVTVQLLQLPLTIYHLRDINNGWLEWLKSIQQIKDATERDVVYEYWMTMTHAQIMGNLDVWHDIYNKLPNEKRYINLEEIGMSRYYSVCNISSHLALYARRGLTGESLKMRIACLKAENAGFFCDFWDRQIKNFFPEEKFYY